ncbi:hypothetical protein P4493_04825 [Bacillus thuringiensis]|jgi:hypothetical protein|uniref:Membrane protein n=3 Tax=Bacillus thuringiensis TaxID=1428 RepID=A0A0B5N8B9_BACTU|nr:MULTISPECIES: hypothetical protein [Bacillus]EAO56858.1 hypothetical protein RBTH_07588 [Bacillus thuringiensis serovar israelensis ATCC 35646]MEC2534366.1 hypothetical protein [Bacillus cereus]MED1153683.1 hypothetical protein [Bacillus paranthracis]OUB09441.1 hypothetical protein BK708_33525 [Bacillus thuringiensis serovar yunnanensis]AFQ30003.1 hypothetical protein BTF1_29512 [Bacillus thuringiensis HD-789]
MEITVSLDVLNIIVRVGILVVQTVIFLSISSLLLFKKDLLDYKRVWIPTVLTIPLYFILIYMGDVIDWSKQTSNMIFFGLMMGSFFPMYFFTYLAKRNYRNKHRYMPKYLEFMLGAFRTFFFLILTLVYGMLIYHFVISFK